MDQCLLFLDLLKEWYGLKTQDNQKNNQNDNKFVNHQIQNHLENKDDFILALYYDPKHPERTDIFTAIPEEVRLIPKLEKETNKILLDETRINKYLRALKLDEKFNKSDYVNSTKRSLGLKILEQYLVDPWWRTHQTYWSRILQLVLEAFVFWSMFSK